MSVEQIGVGASARTTAVRTLILVGADVGEQFLIDMIGLFTPVESRPEIDAPSCAPSCGLLALLLECLLTGIEQGLVVGTGQMMAGLEGNEMTLVTVMRVVVAPVVVPLV